MQAHDEFDARPPRRGASVGLVVMLAIIFGTLAGFGGMVLALWAQQQGHIPAFVAGVQQQPVPINTVGSSSSSSPQSTFAQVAAQLEDSVVNINTTARQQNPYYFFGGPESQVVSGLGTGMIVDANGYILTNYHVIADAEQIMVTVLHKGEKRQYKAQLVGGDKQEDLAIIKIKANNLRPVRFGNSDALQPGEWVMAIGNPFGYEHTVSVGVVSALNRMLPVDDTVTLRNAIQTDASINPGNSGGPLVNMRGEVIGINSAVFVGQGNGGPQANSIGFAIPSNHALKVMQILRKGDSLPYIGIGYTEINEELRSKLHLPVKQGVMVMQVAPNGPSAKAGLQQGDVITTIDGKSLRNQSALGDYISTLSVGKTVKVEIQRWSDGAGRWSKKTLQVKTAKKPANLEQRLRTQEQDPSRTQPQDERGGSDISPWGF